MDMTLGAVWDADIHASRVPAARPVLGVRHPSIRGRAVEDEAGRRDSDCLRHYVASACARSLLPARGRADVVRAC
jgi:hypothetical protein